MVQNDGPNPEYGDSRRPLPEWGPQSLSTPLCHEPNSAGGARPVLQSLLQRQEHAVSKKESI